MSKHNISTRLNIVGSAKDRVYGFKFDGGAYTVGSFPASSKAKKLAMSPGSVADRRKAKRMARKLFESALVG